MKRVSERKEGRPRTVPGEERASRRGRDEELGTSGRVRALEARLTGL